MPADWKQRRKALEQLGEDLRTAGGTGEFAVSFAAVAEEAFLRNQWFTPEHSKQSARALGEMLRPEAMDRWLQPYDLDGVTGADNKLVGLVLAGNLPMVGFHDMLCVAMAGHRLLARFSSDDDVLLPFLVKRLVHHEPGFAGWMQAADGKMQGFDAVIATGSNNSARYFSFYFGKYAHIIRRNRSSVAVLIGEETEGELKLLAQDCLRYFGLGCRNVSKLFVPEDYDFTPLLRVMESDFGHFMEHRKYKNNYDYNKALLLLNKQIHLDNGVVLLTASDALSSPVSVLHYATYDKPKAVEDLLQAHAEQLQCVVSAPGYVPGSVPFGKSQCPEPWDYADGVDAMEFLLSLYR